jgi:hypothetical protein
MIELTEEQRRAVASGDVPVRAVDPQTGLTYVIIPEAVFERTKSLLGSDDLTPDEKLWLLAESGRRAGWDAPEMDAYDHYDENRKNRCQ